MGQHMADCTRQLIDRVSFLEHNSSLNPFGMQGLYSGNNQYRPLGAKPMMNLLSTLGGSGKEEGKDSKWLNEGELGLGSFQEICTQGIPD